MEVSRCRPYQANRANWGDNQFYVHRLCHSFTVISVKMWYLNFAQFIEQVEEVCNMKGQEGPLDQRITLLESMVVESEVNQDIETESMDLAKVCFSGIELIITDLTDPLLSKEEVNGIFQVVTEQFRSFSGIWWEVVSSRRSAQVYRRQKRWAERSYRRRRSTSVSRWHESVVSTQSPKALAPELLELLSVAVLHQFYSQDWWTYLKQKASLRMTPQILSEGATTHLLRLRTYSPRNTADFGASRTNN
jgi:hypothetical protein